MLQFFPNQSEDHIQRISSPTDAYFFILCFLFIPCSLFSHLTGISTENIFVFPVSSLFSVLSQISAKMFDSLLYGGIPLGCQVCIFFNTHYTSVLWKSICFCSVSWRLVICFSLPPFDAVVMPNEENLLFSNSFALIFLLYRITICVAIITQIYLILLADRTWWVFFNTCSDFWSWGVLMGSKVCLSIFSLFLIGVLSSLAGASLV